jgi:hypothetical protein
MNRRDFTLALGSAGMIPATTAAAVEFDEKWLLTLLALREMAQQSLTNSEGRDRRGLDAN